MPYNWQEFLTRWNVELLQSEDVADHGLSEDVKDSRSFGYIGSTKEQLDSAEVRLGQKLPPSYREFLQYSNGWRQTGPFIFQLWSAEQVDWFRVRNQAWIDILTEFELPTVTDTEYLVYGNEVQQPERYAYLQTTLEVSDVGDAAVYLLNPQIVTPQGEWEAWFLASWSPTLNRYPSFWELMQAQYQQFQELNTHAAKRFRVKGNPQLLFSKLPGLVEELDQQAQRYRQYLPTRLGLTALYDNGVIEALELTSKQVRQLIQQHTDAVLLLNALRQLADRAEQQQKYLQTKILPKISHTSFWDTDFPKSAHSASEFGRAEGLRQAAGKIHWFINES